MSLLLGRSAGPVVCFRADAAAHIGVGHVMRCLTLATHLIERGARPIFLCRHISDELVALIESKGIRVIRLPRATGPIEVDATVAHSAWLEASWQVDAKQCCDALEGLIVDWLVVDHYALDWRWEAAMRRCAKRLMAIDDLADRQHECELLLDQNLFPDMETRYTDLVPPTCSQLLGPSFALLRDEFRRVEPVRVSGTARNVVVFFGSADVGNLTGLVLEALRDRDVTVDVLLGGAHPHEGAIREQACTLGSARVERFTDDMAGRMANADLFIGAGGATNWERCALGVPSIVISVAENQTPVAEALANEGAILYLGTSNSLLRRQLDASLATLIDNAHLRRALARAGRALVDAQGTRRVANMLLAGLVTVRLATASDCEAVFRWRNDKATREVSFDSTPLAWETHVDWFTQSLLRNDRILLIGEYEGEAIGIIRFDIVASEALVSVSVAPEAKHLGLGRGLIRAGGEWLHEHSPTVESIKAEILDENIASQRAFEASGYRLKVLTYKQVLFGPG